MLCKPGGKEFSLEHEPEAGSIDYVEKVHDNIYWSQAPDPNNWWHQRYPKDTDYIIFP